MRLFSLMNQRTATVADLRNNFRRVAAWLENGESVEILKRGRRYARLTPAAAPGKSTKVDFAHQLQSAWGNRVFSAAEVQAMRDAEREGMA
jgi:antitoxin (DNA-binding transcriptional repressor) of toxin-antitoxin stability system